MSNVTPTVLRSADLQASQVHTIEVLFSLSSGTPSLSGPSKRAPVAFGVATGGTLAQSVLDSLLGTADEIDADVAFGSTAMGVDAIGIVVDCKGQVAELQAVEYLEHGGAAGLVIPSGSAMPDTLTNGAFLTANGNIAARLVVTGLDSSSDPLLVRFHVRLKNHG